MGLTADKGNSNNSDPIERFNPWMQATSRKTRKVMKEKVVQNSGATHPGTVRIGSGKFSTLVALDQKIEAVQEPVVQSDSVADASTTAKETEAYNNGGKNGNMTPTNNVGVTSSEEVIPVRVSLDPKSHVAVRVLESDKEKYKPPSQGRRTSTGVGSPRPKGIQRQLVSTGEERKSGQNCKKSDGRSSSKITLWDCIRDLERELSRTEKNTAATPTSKHDVQREGFVSSIHWRENTTFA
ncbi:hypothetical protein V6N12_002837 [Hibiscus sabdariffa]|uniref:Uncharacterized protein n=1 Tax=Hibiscus sabdariffa TaxID=183260 RepID=A0ABR2EBP1_9ROSI